MLHLASILCLIEHGPIGWAAQAQADRVKSHMNKKK